jgi:hypothetical protein
VLPPCPLSCLAGLLFLHASRSSLYEQSNQYPPMMGLSELRQAVAAHSGRHAGIAVDWQTESLITLGATEALAGAFLGLLNARDEVIMFEPLYDSYVPMARRAGGVPRWAWSCYYAGCVAPGLSAHASVASCLLRHYHLPPGSHPFLGAQLPYGAASCPANRGRLAELCSCIRLAGAWYPQSWRQRSAPAPSCWSSTPPTTPLAR